MAKATVPAKVSKRKAREDRLLKFQDLADFANLGNKPSDWGRFRQKCADFFPANIAEWIYINAEVWWNLSNLPAKRPANYRQLLHKCIADWAATDKQWTKVKKEMATLRPPLLFYRTLLCRVWRGKDPYGDCLGALLGFDDAHPDVLEPAEQQKEDDLVFEEKGNLVRIPGHIETGNLFTWRVPEKPRQHTIGPFTYIDKQRATDYCLPMGRPRVDGNTSTINWEFGCQFQTAIYYLVQERWRAKVCPQCRKYFVADKAAQKYCSTKCCGERKQKVSLDYYNRIGKDRRQESKATQTRAPRRKS